MLPITFSKKKKKMLSSTKENLSPSKLLTNIYIYMVK